MSLYMPSDLIFDLFDLSALWQLQFLKALSPLSIHSSPEPDAEVPLCPHPVDIDFKGFAVQAPNCATPAGQWREVRLFHLVEKGVDGPRVLELDGSRDWGNHFQVGAFADGLTSTWKQQLLPKSLYVGANYISGLRRYETGQH